MSASSKKKLRKEQMAANLTEKQLQEQREAKKLKTYTVTFAIVMVLVVAIVLGVIVAPYVEGALRSGSHAVTIGEHELSASELSYYYVDAISNYHDEVYSQYYSYYGNYWSLMLGFDTTKALDKQIKDQEKNTTWADYFIDIAIENAKSVYALYDDAMSKNFKMSEEDQKTLDNSLASLPTYAKYNDCDTVNEYLRTIYGPSANEKEYAEYFTITCIASAYYDDHADSLEYEAKDYRAYENEKKHMYNRYTFVYHSLNMSSYLGEGTKDDKGNTTWTDEEKNAAREKVKADMEKLKAAGITNKLTFDEALQSLDIYKYDKDGKPVADDKKTTAKESKDTFYDYMYVNEAAKKWIIEEGRKDGDLGVFPIYDSASAEEKDESKKLVNGYYIVLFNECDTNEVLMANVRHILVKFEGGTKDKDGNVTYSDKEKQAAKTEAEKLYKEFQDSIKDEKDIEKIEKKFSELANKKSDDQNGKVTNGGLYEDIYPGQMVEPFEKWCFEEGRKTGDTGLVETEYGWHIMFYSSTDELTYRDFMIENDMIADDMEKWHEDLLKKTTATIVNLTFMEYDIVVG
ncbi:MAG: hypothetical protein E7470_02440 [Ruminococcaceae bacterium]|nr:hypothetical protein [Oscillospiraceae bacterium]